MRRIRSIFIIENDQIRSGKTQQLDSGAWCVQQALCFVSPRCLHKKKQQLMLARVGEPGEKGTSMWQLGHSKEDKVEIKICTHKQRILISTHT